MKPTKNDVLSGRGAGFNQHPGNEQFRKMINIQKVSRMSQYIFSMAQLHQNCLERNCDMCNDCSIAMMSIHHTPHSSSKGCLHGWHEEAKDGHLQSYR